MGEADGRQRQPVESQRMGQLGAGRLDPAGAEHADLDVSDSDGKKIDGYNTVDFLGSYALPVGKVSFSVENLLDKDYTTAWGQRAPGLYSPTYGAPGLYTYKGADVPLV